MKLHPQIIEKDGRKEFVVIPYDEFLAIQELLEDLDDLSALREAREGTLNETPVPFETFCKENGL